MPLKTRGPTTLDTIPHSINDNFSFFDQVKDRCKEDAQIQIRYYFKRYMKRCCGDLVPNSFEEYRNYICGLPISKPPGHWKHIACNQEDPT